MSATFSIDTETGCWMWQGAKNSQGYAVRRIRGKNHLVHRLHYEEYVGDIPDGKELDHFVCSTPECVNPFHLRPSTHAQNLQRSRRTRFTQDQIEAIRSSSLPQKEIAKQYRVHPAYISMIKSGKRWPKHD